MSHLLLSVYFAEETNKQFKGKNKYKVIVNIECENTIDIIDFQDNLTNSVNELLTNSVFNIKVIKVPIKT